VDPRPSIVAMTDVERGNPSHDRPSSIVVALRRSHRPKLIG
jgi:hypothetical protein